MTKIRYRPVLLGLAVAALLVSALAVTGYPAHAAPSADAGQASTAALSAPAASGTPCNFLPSLKSCQSTDPTVSLNTYNFGNNSGCSYLWTIGWGDGSPQTIAAQTSPADGHNFLASHTYKAPGTYTIRDTGQVTAGTCTVGNGVHTFILASASSAAPTATSSPTSTDYGALSFSHTASNGAARRAEIIRTEVMLLADTKGDAEWVNESNCIPNGGNGCVVELWFYHAWAALAVSANGASGFGWGPTEVDAVHWAMHYCTTEPNNGGGCNIINEGHTSNVNANTAAGGASTLTEKQAVPYIPSNIMDVFKTFTQAIGPALSCAVGFTKLGPLITFAKQALHLAKGDLNGYARTYVWGWACLDSAPKAY